MRECPLLYYLHDGATVPGYVSAEGWTPPTKAPTDGPDGLSGGKLSTPCSGEYDLHFSKATHLWTDVTAGLCPDAEKDDYAGRIFIGVARGGVILPTDLAREKSYDGHAVELLGQQWIVPPARLARGGTSLPQTLTLDSCGQLEYKVEAVYESLCGYACKYWDHFVVAASDFSYTDLHGACAAALGVNYRIGIYEAAALLLLSMESCAEIMRALIDWPAVEEIIRQKEQKKTLNPVA